MTEDGSKLTPEQQAALARMRREVQQAQSEPNRPDRGVPPEREDFLIGLYPEDTDDAPDDGSS